MCFGGGAEVAGPNTAPYKPEDAYTQVKMTSEPSSTKASTTTPQLDEPSTRPISTSASGLSTKGFM